MFNRSWLTDERYCKWLAMDHSSKYAAYCNVCEQLFQLGTMGVRTLDSLMQSVKHNEKGDMWEKEGEFNNQLRVGECQCC